MRVLIKKYWFLIGLAVISVILRIYKIEDLFYFSYDEAIPAFVGKNLNELQKLPLIGGVTPFGVHLPPYFYWLLAVTISVGNLDPLWWGVVGAIGSILTIVMLYVVGADFFGKKVGLFASIIWAFSLLANIYDRHFWALYWGPMLCLSTVYCLSKVVAGDKRFVLLLSLVFIWSTATDPSNLVFIFLSILVYAIYRIKITKKEMIVIILVLISLTPLLVFDLRHNFANTKPLLEYLKADKTASRFEDQTIIDRTEIFTNSMTRLFYPFGSNEIAKQYSYCDAFITEKNQTVPSIFKLISLALLAMFVLYSFKSRKPKHYLLGLTIVIYFVGIQAYGFVFNGDIFEHYITSLFPIFILIASYYISYLPKKTSFVLIGLFMFFNLYSLSKLQNNHGLTNKKQAIDYVSSTLGNESFSLESLSTCWRYSGYRYLFAAYGNEPTKSYVDPNLGHLYGSTPISSTHPNKVVSIVTHDFIEETAEFYTKYALYKSHQISSAIFGNIEVILMDNSSKWF